MKKIHFIAITVALLFVTTAVFAFGLPKVNTGSSIGDKIVNTASDEGKNLINKAVVDDLNKKLSEYTSSCKCNMKTGKITGCNFAKMKKEIKVRQVAVKEFLGKNFKMKTEVANACWANLESNIPNDADYWSWWNSQWVDTPTVSIQAVR
ncbi:MAG: hypothetical protein HQM16_12935 [Deltaproteobacteria bacterium]|nr:hypothetical protein [Deltaproteobacteria bacterium]